MSNGQDIGEMVMDILGGANQDDVDARFTEENVIAVRVFEPGSDEYREYSLTIEELE